MLALCVCHPIHSVSDSVLDPSGSAPSKKGWHAQSEKTSSGRESTAAKVQRTWGCLPVCCPLPPRVDKGGGNVHEEVEAKRQLDAEEEVCHGQLPSDFCTQGDCYRALISFQTYAQLLRWCYADRQRHQPHVSCSIRGHQLLLCMRAEITCPCKSFIAWWDIAALHDI